MGRGAGALAAVKQWAAGAAGLALAAGFVGAAATMGLMASTGSVWPETHSAWLLVIGALVSSAMLALGPLATVGRRRWWAAAVLVPVWVVCAGFSMQSIVKFSAENLLDREAGRLRAADDYAIASDRIRQLRDQRSVIDELRAVEALDAEIARLLAKPTRAGTVGERTRSCEAETWRAEAECGEVGALRAARETAARRDELDGKITEAIKARARLAPTAAADAAGRLSGAEPGKDAAAPSGVLIRATRWITGLDIRTAEENRAVSLALLIWLGEILVPLGVSLAGRGWPPVRDPVPTGSRAALSGQPDVVRATVAAWAGERVTRDRSVRTAAGVLYADFERWCAAGGRTPPSAYVFGLMLTNELGWRKRKQGKAGLICYEGVALAPLAAARSGGRLRLLIGGARA